MALEELGPAEGLAAGAIGEPGDRRFYLQITVSGKVISLAIEKQQVAALAAQGLEVLERHHVSSDEAAIDRLADEGREIIDPGDEGERFRVGDVSLALSVAELLTITVSSAEDPDAGVSFVIAPEQFRAMARVALELVASGRPICPTCRLPMDPGGHECPARNGHRRS